MAAKILLVEDDNNLREIYEARLLAEGYTIVTARDGEEALVVAKSEKPDLVISDVMMPRISGFEMLDILRNTAELKYTKVIMLTALGQADDQTRANSLGADRYLVKSQVTLEDIVKAAHELIEGAAATAVPAPAAVVPETSPVTPAPAAIPVVAAPPIAVAPAPAPAPVVPVPAPAAVVPETSPVTPAPAAIPVVAAPPIAVAPAPAPAPVVPVPAPAAPEVHLPEPTPVMPPTIPATPTPAAALPPQPRVQSPTLEQATPPSNADNVAETTAQEEATVHSQIESFINTNLTHPEASAGQPITASTPPVAAADDSLLAQAVDALNASNNSTTTSQTVPPADNSPEDSVSPINEASNTLPSAALTTSQDTTTIAPSNNTVTIANKKVIQPLKSEPKPGLNELLAREEAKEIINPSPVITSANPGTPPEQNITTSTPPAVGPPGGDVFAPSTPPESSSPQEPQSGIDPNSIAL